MQALHATHSVLGQRVKGEVGQRGIARDMAIQVRKSKLKPLIENRGKDNTFKDRRIGEYDKVWL